MKEWLAPRAQVVSHLRGWIEDGTLSQGQQLPSERTLAQQLGVSRETVRSALEVLFEEGLIRPNGARSRIVSVPVDQKQTTRGAGKLLENSVAVLTRHVEARASRRSSGWYEYFAQGVTVAVRESGLHVLTLHPDRASEEEIEHLCEAAPRGVVVVDTIGDSSAALREAQILQKRGVPVVVLGDAPHLEGFDRVASDHETGSYELTKWLLAQGRRRPLLLWQAPPGVSWFAPRRAGYERAMREAGLEALPVIEMEPIFADDLALWEKSARATAGYLVEHLVGATPADAVMVATDSAAFAAAAACRLCGRQPSRDVLIAGYDNYWRDCAERSFESAVPAVTVEKFNDQIGAQAVRLLLDRVSAHLPCEPQLRLVAPQVIATEAV